VKNNNKLIVLELTDIQKTLIESSQYMEDETLKVQQIFTDIRNLLNIKHVTK